MPPWVDLVGEESSGRSVKPNVWTDEGTGDVVILGRIDLVPDLPAHSRTSSGYGTTWR